MKQKLYKIALAQWGIIKIHFKKNNSNQIKTMVQSVAVTWLGSTLEIQNQQTAGVYPDLFDKRGPCGALP